MDELLRRYLNGRGFEIDEETKYKVQFISDFVMAFIYTVVSGFLIGTQKSELVVELLTFGLNIISAFRALLSNVISAAKVTENRKGAEVDKKHGSHYRDKALFLSAIFFIAVLALVLLMVDFSYVFSKAFAITVLVLVFINDTDNIIICAYNAKL